jgi:hypothetical protein
MVILFAQERWSAVNQCDWKLQFNKIRDIGSDMAANYNKTLGDKPESAKINGTRR